MIDFQRVRAAAGPRSHKSLIINELRDSLFVYRLSRLPFVKASVLAVDVSQCKRAGKANTCADCADGFIAQGDHEDRGEGHSVGEGGDGDTSGEFDVFFHVGESVRILGESVNLFYRISLLEDDLAFIVNLDQAQVNRIVDDVKHRWVGVFVNP